MTIVLSPEAQAKAERIPNFAQRLERFINDQYALEQWRAQRLKAMHTPTLPDIETGLVYREGHWAAVGELPPDFDLERFIAEQREARIHQINNR